MAVVDIRMPPGQSDEGVIAAERIRADYPDIGVLLLSQYVNPRYGMRLLEEHPGRIGYLLKDRVSDMAVLTVPGPIANTDTPNSRTSAARHSANRINAVLLVM